MTTPALLLFSAFALYIINVSAIEPTKKDVERSIRVVRFMINYPNVDNEQVQKIQNWSALLRKSVLASLKFVNKHWIICGEEEQMEKTPNDCGKLQVTGEPVNNNYRINATFIANRDPIKNVKQDSVSTAISVVQIGLRGGIFQYTNALKVLGKPNTQLEFEEAFFCFPGYELGQDKEKCHKAAKKTKRHL